MISLNFKSKRDHNHYIFDLQRTQSKVNKIFKESALLSMEFLHVRDFGTQYCSHVRVLETGNLRRSSHSMYEICDPSGARSSCSS